MMRCVPYPENTLKEYKYVVVFSLYQGKLLLSRHRQRKTWETQGGHIERGETPYEAAGRELREESGALRFLFTPACDYHAGYKHGHQENGMVFIARIESMGLLPDSEMAETALFDSLPDNLTYPGITPVLYEYCLDKIAAIKDRGMLPV